MTLQWKFSQKSVWLSLRSLVHPSPWLHYPLFFLSPSIALHASLYDH